MMAEQPATPPFPEGSIVITPAEVYGKVTSLTESVDRLVMQNEGAIERRREDQAATEKRERHVDEALGKLDGRLSALERRVWMIAGAASALGATLGAWLPGVVVR